MWFLALVVFGAGAYLSYHYESLVPGIICSVIALCVYAWQVFGGGD